MQTQSKWWQILIMGLIFTTAGIIMIFFSISTIKTYNEKNEKYIETNATVVDYAYDNDGLQAIIVEYSVNRQKYRKQSNSYSNMPKSIGTEVSIKYNPNNPQDAIWTNDSTNIILPILASIFTIVGIIIVIKALKDLQNNKIVESNVTQQSNGLYSNPILDNSNSSPADVNQQTFNQNNTSPPVNNSISEQNNTQDFMQNQNNQN